MAPFQNRPVAKIVLASAAIIAIVGIRSADAQEPASKAIFAGIQEAKSEPTPSKQPDPKQSAAGSTAAGKGFDPAVVSAGQAAFEQSCTKCHVAERALSRSKDLAGWQATVRRMAGKQGASIPSEDLEPIATYLASRTAAASGAPLIGGGEAASSADNSSFSAFATLSPLWRGGKNTILPVGPAGAGNIAPAFQNPGFVPEAWVGATWQGKILSVRVTSCVSCHGVPADGSIKGGEDVGTLSRLDIVEAAVRVDLSQWLDPHCMGMKGSIDAGRFVVPFGAFSAQVNPGLYNTVTPPLIFNMGQRVFLDQLGTPVLPMPYAAEGANLNLDVPLFDVGDGKITATLDAYLINGLEGNKNDGIYFQASRDLADNNNSVAGGGRFTIGGPYVRVGASYMHGQYNNIADVANPFPTPLEYTIYGFDVQAHYKDLVRFQFEWARRNEQRAPDAVGNFIFTEHVDGYYFETEVRPWEKCFVSLLARYDTLQRRSFVPPQNDDFGVVDTSNFNVHRTTLGLNFALWRQSLLMVNWEHWRLPDGLPRSLNVYGIRYAVTF